MADLFERKRRLAYSLEGEEWTLTTEGLKQKAIEAGKLRIAYYGSDSEYGETCFIGTLEQCEEWAIERGIHDPYHCPAFFN
jgi:hypothetical protein